MSEVNAWSATAASNNSSPPDGAPENMARSAVNNVMRENMAVIKRWQADTNGSITSGGTANAQTIAANRTTTSAYAGETFTFKAGSTNTGATTVNITPSGGSARGAVAIQRNGLALTGREITAGGMYTIRYDGTVYQLSESTEPRIPWTDFTPGLTFNSAAVGMTFTEQTGRYCRIANVVFYDITLTLSAKGSSTGAAEITGLPIAAASVTGIRAWSVPIGYTLSINLDVAGGYYSAAGTITEGGTTITLVEVGDNVSPAQLTDADFADTSRIRMRGWYEV